MTPQDVLDAPNLGEMIRRASLAFADRTAHMRPTKQGFVSITYRELFEEIWEYARAIDSYGLQPGDKVVILGESGHEWALVDWACQTLGLVSVPIYPSLPPDQAQHILNDCGAKLVVASDKKLASKVSGVDTMLWTKEEGFTYILDRVAESKLERAAWEEKMGTFDSEEVATFIYTSGTTGVPKGAMLPHRCFQTLNNGVTDSLPVTSEDRFLSFLPLSHVFERYAGHVLPMSMGACVAYAGSLASLSGDMVKVKPTIMLCVPRFLEATRAKIVESIKKQKPLNQTLFNIAMDQGKKKANRQFAPLAGIMDSLVSSKVREKTGGNIRFFVSGGAALAPHVSDFYIALGIPVLQGYGLTETCAGNALNHPDDIRPWTVGPPIKGVEIKIGHDGEILVRGGAVMKGYFNMPEETAKAIDEDGWFHTGDIGEFEDGFLKITDRKKDLLVLANGKNIAPQAIENKLKESEYVNEAVLFGDGFAYCYALIVPEFDAVKAWLKSKGIEESDPAKIVQMDEVKALIKSGVDKANSQLADFEKVKKHQLVGAMFTVDGGELTPSMKVKRRVVKDKYKDLLKLMEAE